MKQYQPLLWYSTIQHNIHTKFGKGLYNKKEYDDNSKNRQHILNIMYICVSYDVVDDTLLSYHQPRTNIEKKCKLDLQIELVKKITW